MLTSYYTSLLKHSVSMRTKRYFCQFSYQSFQYDVIQIYQKYVQVNIFDMKNKETIFEIKNTVGSKIYTLFKRFH